MLRSLSGHAAWGRAAASTTTSPTRPSLGGGCFPSLSLTAARRRLQRGDDSRPVLDNAFERTGTALVEIEAARHRLDPHLEVLDLDAQPRRLEHEVVNELV